MLAIPTSFLRPQLQMDRKVHDYLLTTEDPDSYTVINQKCLIEDMKSIWPGNLLVLPYSGLLADLQEYVKVFESERDPVVNVCISSRVSLDGTIDAGISRVWNCGRNGHVVMPNPREKVPSVSRIQRTSHIDRNLPIRLIDDGAFSGETVIKTAEVFQNEGFKVVEIVLGVAPRKGRSRITSSLPGVELRVIRDELDFVDWTSEVDYDPIARFGGRLMGEPLKRYPYLTPFIDEELWSCWTGLPERYANWFSTRRVEEAIAYGGNEISFS